MTVFPGRVAQSALPRKRQSRALEYLPVATKSTLL